jgi:hypothetical protein
MDESIFSRITETGFAIFIAIFLLIRFEKKVESLTEAINNLMRAFEDAKKGRQAKRGSIKSILFTNLHMYSVGSLTLVQWVTPYINHHKVPMIP